MNAKFFRCLQAIVSLLITIAGIRIHMHLHGRNIIDVVVDGCIVRVMEHQSNNNNDLYNSVLSHTSTKVSFVFH